MLKRTQNRDNENIFLQILSLSVEPVWKISSGNTVNLKNYVKENSIIELKLAKKTNILIYSYGIFY